MQSIRYGGMLPICQTWRCASAFSGICRRSAWKPRCSVKRCPCPSRWHRLGCVACTRVGGSAGRARCGGQGIPFTLSTVSVCPIEEVAPQISRPMWFQLYVLRDRGFMRNALERAKAAGCTTLVFTVDMPTPGARYRDAHSGMSGKHAALRRYWQAVTHPRWALDVGLQGRPHDLGNISTYLGKPTGLEDYIGWLAKNFDPSISTERSGMDP